MKAIWDIIQNHGGIEALKASHIRIENEPFMPLVIESIGQQNGNEMISVAHYGEQNGDLMRDPEVTFEIMQTGKPTPLFIPLDYRNDYTATSFPCDRQFPRIWNRNIAEQDYLAAFKAAKAMVAA